MAYITLRDYTTAKPAGVHNVTNDTVKLSAAGGPFCGVSTESDIVYIINLAIQVSFTFQFPIYHL
jgi:hypothetical protein